MSFRCDACGTAPEPRTKPVELPVEFREKEYKGYGEIRIGYEIARMVKLCTECGGDIKPSVDRILNHELQGQEREIVLTALRGVGRKNLGGEA